MTSEPQLFDERHLEIFADDFAFSIADGVSFTTDPSPQWIDNLMYPQLLATTTGVIAVGTVRDFTVPVTIQRWDQDPCDSYGSWDQVTDASIRVSTGELVIMGNSDYPPRAPRMSVPPDNYRARVYYSGLDTIAPNGLDGDDHYRIALWPGPYHPITIVKQHSHAESVSHLACLSFLKQVSAAARARKPLKASARRS